MLVNNDIVDELYFDAGSQRVQKARLYVKTGRVEIEKINYNDENNFEVTGNVTGQDIYRTHINVEDGEIIDVTCECPDYQGRYAACKHIVATMMEFSTNGQCEEMIGGSNVGKINRT